MEPTPDELKDLNSIEDMASWVPWRSPTLKSVLIGLGVELADPPRIIAVLAEGIITEAAGKHYDSSGPVEPNVDGANKLSDADVSRLTLLWNTCRLKCGLIKLLIEWLIEGLTEWFTEWFIQWSTQWLIEWMAE